MTEGASASVSCSEMIFSSPEALTAADNCRRMEQRDVKSVPNPKHCLLYFLTNLASVIKTNLLIIFISFIKAQHASSLVLQNLYAFSIMIMVKQRSRDNTLDNTKNIMHCNITLKSGTENKTWVPYHFETIYSGG